MFEPFRCENCIHGIYNQDKSCWDCDYNVVDETECEELYEDDERM